MAKNSPSSENGTVRIAATSEEVAKRIKRASKKQEIKLEQDSERQKVVLDQSLTQLVIKDWPNEYIPVTPTPLQLGFCILPSRSVLYGGAAGGGKSEALLMAALQYVRVPGYSAIIFRKSYADLSRAGALMDRALEWLAPHLGKTIRWDWQTKTFYFPSGAKLAFGYMGEKSAGDAVQGAEYHFVGVDEVTQHYEQDVAWAESRLRRKNEATNIPLRARFTANPGNRGHAWVKKRFGIKRNPAWNRNVGKEVEGHFFSEEPMFIGTNPEEVFIPARLIDNPYVDLNYIRSFKNMDEVTRAQLLDGDWDSSPASRFRREWFPRYTKRGEYYLFGANEVLVSGMRRFCTVDVAASVKEGVGGEQFYTSNGKEKTPCWTVVSTWGLANGFLFLLDVTRGQVESPDVFTMIEQCCKKWRAHDVYVEGNGVGRPIAQVAQRHGLPVTELWTFYDKIQNSYVASMMAKAGKILLPNEEMGMTWLEDFENEVFTWTGHPHETSDQIDTLSSAAKVVESELLPSTEGYDDRNLTPVVLPGPRNF